VLESRLDGDGRVMVVSSEHRSQLDNIEAAIARMGALLAMALVRPKRRKKPKPSYGSKMRRLDEKRKHSETKRRRAGRDGD
jgi:ribosome-associated protein